MNPKKKRKRKRKRKEREKILNKPDTKKEKIFREFRHQEKERKKH